jgi:hypothetical protein
LERPPKKNLRDRASVLGRECNEDGLVERTLEKRAVCFNYDTSLDAPFDDGTLLTEWMNLLERG